jgi:hypothetical protein
MNVGMGFAMRGMTMVVSTFTNLYGDQIELSMTYTTLGD